jgi:RimJ/RimL family protein N-acetyltransferase
MLHCTIDARAALPLTAGHVRRLWPSDLAPARDHLLRLDPVTRRERFSGAVSDAYLQEHARQALLSDGLVLGYRVGNAVRGMAELRGMAPGVAEGAFSVEAGHRRRGIGHALFRRLLLAARNRDIRTLHLRCMPDNRAMQALARRHGARLVFDGDAVLGEVATEAPTVMSLWQEALAEHLALPLALYDRRPVL